MREVLRDARERGVGVGAFNIITVEHAEGLVAGAERVGAPLVLQISQNCVEYHGALRPIAAAVLAIAEEAAVDVVVHLDHAEDAGLVAEAVRLGLPSVMFDGSRLSDEENLAATARVVSACAAAGVDVEAELGEVGGKDGVHAATARTDPDHAAAFVAATGVGSLAVAVGSSHAKAARDMRIDQDLIRRLSEAVPVPLVLHGSSSLDDDQLGAAVGAGMTKINLATHLNRQFTAAVRARLAAEPALLDPRPYLRDGRDALADEAARLLAVLGGARRPAEAETVE
jgi:fructose-bisphosphate aldolase class II/tagatose 1,6-diphosphate aldolase GatY/KbaY